MPSTDDLRALAGPLLAGTGLELWDVETSADVVRVLVDRPGGIDLEALAAASGALSSLLDDHPEVAPGRPYQLEVSSPGLERTLRTSEQYRRFVGASLTVKTATAIEGSRRFKGTLVAVGDDDFQLLTEGPAAASPITVRYDQVERTRTVLVWGPDADKPKTPGGSRRRAHLQAATLTEDVAGIGADVKDTP